METMRQMMRASFRFFEITATRKLGVGGWELVGSWELGVGSWGATASQRDLFGSWEMGDELVLQMQLFLFFQYENIAVFYNFQFLNLDQSLSLEL